MPPEGLKTAGNRIPKERERARLKLFSAHYLAHKNVREATRAAGYKGTDGSLSTQGSKLLRKAESLGLISAAAEKVVAKVERNAEEWAQRLWEQVDEAKASEVWKDGDGNVKVQKFQPLKALVALGQLYAPKDKQPEGNRTLVLANLPPEAAASLYRSFLATEPPGVAR